MRLKEIRISRGISQAKAASDLNLLPVVYGRYENGQREPSNAILIAMANYFGVTVDDLLGRVATETERKQENEIFEIKERLRSDPAYRLLFSAANKATPDHLKAAAAMLKALEQEDNDAN